MTKPSVEHLDLKTTIVTYRSKSTGLFTSVCPALQLSATGSTADEAEQELEELLHQFLEKLYQDERLPEMLSQMPDTGEA